jgi:hypothetical protein
MYQIYVQGHNQKSITTFVQGVAVFLKQCGQEFIDVARILASIGGGLLATGNFLSLIF